MKTILRQDYMNNNVGHREYYGQFVTDNMRNVVVKRFGIDRLAAALEKDEHLNTVPLIEWDSLSEDLYINNLDFRARMKEANDTVSLAGCV